MIARVRSRASKRGIPFDLTAEDIHIPEVCPVLGITLVVGGGDAAPSLDRLDPDRGYVPGNVIVVSNRANRLRSDATPEELAAITRWYTRMLR